MPRSRPRPEERTGDERLEGWPRETSSACFPKPCALPAIATSSRRDDRVAMQHCGAILAHANLRSCQRRHACSVACLPRRLTDSKPAAVSSCDSGPVGVHSEANADGIEALSSASSARG